MLATVKEVLETGVPPDIHDSIPVCQAAFFGSIEDIDAAAGTAGVEAKDKWGMAALHWAAIAQQHDAIVHLTERKSADADTVDGFGFTPLMYASGRYASVSICRQLLKHGANANLANMHGSTALHMAALLGHHDVVGVLLEVGKADVSVKNMQGHAPLDLAKDAQTRAILSGVNHSPGNAGGEAGSRASGSGSRYRVTVCDGCGATSDMLLACSACHDAFYCKKECQMQHWKAGHKTYCHGVVYVPLALLFDEAVTSSHVPTLPLDLFGLPGGTSDALDVAEMTKPESALRPRFLVKVQTPDLSLMSAELAASPLVNAPMIYNQSRSIKFRLTVAASAAKIRTKMAGKIKCFFHANVNRECTGVLICVDTLVDTEFA